jgi:lysophospholipase L1-like esterase
MDRFNAVVRRVAHKHDVVLMESVGHPAAHDRETYAADGFHPSAEGHRKAAREFLRAIRKRFRLHTA